MAATVPPRSTPRLGVGVVLILAGATLAVALLPELATGFRDTDNAAESLAWLRGNIPAANLSSSLLLVAGALLIVGSFGLRRRLREGGGGFALESASVFGIVAGTLYAVAGAIRGNGESILYIDTLDAGWAESAYLATHVIGTQSLLPLAELGTSGWLVAIAIGGARRGLPGLLAVGVLPALTLVLLLVGKLIPGFLTLDVAGVGWALHIANLLVAVPLGIVALGITTLVPGAWARWGSPTPTESKSGA